MPTYRYECAGCGRVHEIFHSMSEEPRRECSECGGSLERLIGGGGGVLLKGSGFYSTDNRSGDYRAAAKKEAGGSPKEGKGAKGDASKKTKGGSGGSKKKDGSGPAPKGS